MEAPNPAKRLRQNPNSLPNVSGFNQNHVDLIISSFLSLPDLPSLSSPLSIGRSFDRVLDKLFDSFGEDDSVLDRIANRTLQLASLLQESTKKCYQKRASANLCNLNSLSLPRELTTEPCDNDPDPAVGKTFQMHPKKPTEPPFPQLEVANTFVGNTDFTAELKAEGKLGLFFDRTRARMKPIAVTLNVTAYYNGMCSTIFESMSHLLKTKMLFIDTSITDRLVQVSNQLAAGACVATYLKLHALIYTEFADRYDSAYLKRPKAAIEDSLLSLPVVAPFAFAIQQLGAVNIANLTRPERYVPVLPPTGHQYGLPNNHVWDPNKYAQSVEYARNLGLHFNVVDLTRKNGTAWWLLRQHYSEEMFELKLPFPDVNYTSAMAVTHTLFLLKSLDPSNAIFDLTPCGDADYGYILRDPHLGINVTTFQTIDETAKQIVRNL